MLLLETTAANRILIALLYRGVATSMIARHKKPRHDLIVVLHLKSCGAAKKSLRGCKRRAIIEVATQRLQSETPTMLAQFFVTEIIL